MSFKSKHRVQGYNKNLKQWFNVIGMGLMSKKDAYSMKKFFIKNVDDLIKLKSLF